jgi:hypothetical protein
MIHYFVVTFHTNFSLEGTELPVAALIQISPLHQHLTEVEEDTVVIALTEAQAPHLMVAPLTEVVLLMELVVVMVEAVLHLTERVLMEPKLMIRVMLTVMLLCKDMKQLLLIQIQRNYF